MAPGGSPFAKASAFVKTSAGQVGAAGGSGRKTTSRVSRSLKAVGVDWFDGFIETNNFMGVPFGL